MREIEISDEEWPRLKKRLFNYGVGALIQYPCPVKLVHGKEYVVYDFEKDDENDSSINK